MDGQMEQNTASVGGAVIHDMTISVVDNGFVVRITGYNFNKHYVVQAASKEADEIEPALDIIRSVYAKFMGEN